MGHRIFYLNIKTNDIVESYEVLNNKELVDIDENIAIAISSLNELGYKTKYCCEGHAEYSSEYDCFGIGVPYITFEDGVHLPSCPEGWKLESDDTGYDENDNEIKGYWETIYAMEVSETDKLLDFYKVKLDLIIKLFEWIESIYKKE